MLFLLDLRTNLLKNTEIQIQPAENFTINYVCENSTNEKFKIIFRNFSYWVK